MTGVCPGGVPSGCDYKMCCDCYRIRPGYAGQNFELADVANTTRANATLSEAEGQANNATNADVAERIPPALRGTAAKLSQWCAQANAQCGEVGLAYPRCCDGMKCSGWVAWGRPGTCVSSETTTTTLAAHKQQQGEPCGVSGSTGYFNGDCADGLVCAASTSGAIGASKSCMRPKKQKGEQCGQSGSTGYYNGECAEGLDCMSPPEAMPGAPKTCQAMLGRGGHCGTFGSSGNKIAAQCVHGLACTCRGPTPCREWANECYLFCC